MKAFIPFCAAVSLFTATSLPLAAARELDAPSQTPFDAQSPTTTASHRALPVTFNLGRPDSHAPINIMADHTHHAGEWMLGFRYMFRNMDGLRHHASDVTSQDVFKAGHLVAPEHMSMNMFMGSLMFAPTDWLTLMGMWGYSYMEMEHRIAPTARPLIQGNNGADHFTARSGGFTDLEFTPLFRLFEKNNMRLVFGAGMSIPTGSIFNRDVVPSPGGRRNRLLSPSMEIGSGTFDFLPSLTWTQLFPIWSYGTQVRGTARTGRNARGYRLGNEIGADIWAALNVSRWFSLNTTLGYQWEGRLKNAQGYHANSGGQDLDAGVGFNILVPSGCFKGNRFAVEIQFPMWQNLNGYQLKQSLTVTAGWQYSF